MKTEHKNVWLELSGGLKICFHTSPFLLMLLVFFSYIHHVQCQPWTTGSIWFLILMWKQGFAFFWVFGYSIEGLQTLKQMRMSKKKIYYKLLHQKMKGRKGKFEGDDVLYFGLWVLLRNWEQVNMLQCRRSGNGKGNFCSQAWLFPACFFNDIFTARSLDCPKLHQNTK